MLLDGRITDEGWICSRCSCIPFEETDLQLEGAPEPCFGSRQPGDSNGQVQYTLLEAVLEDDLETSVVLDPDRGLLV